MRRLAPSCSGYSAHVALLGSYDPDKELIIEDRALRFLFFVIVVLYFHFVAN